MPYYDKCEESYRLFELARLPAIVVLVLQPYDHIWQFLSNNREAADADDVAKFLAQVLLIINHYLSFGSYTIIPS